jgi:hypothetical protein
VNLLAIALGQRSGVRSQRLAGKVSFEENIVGALQSGRLLLQVPDGPGKQRQAEEMPQDDWDKRWQLLPMMRNELGPTHPIHAVVGQDDLLPSRHVIGIE